MEKKILYIYIHTYIHTHTFIHIYTYTLPEIQAEFRKGRRT